MEFDVPSQREFENLESRFNALLIHMGLKFELCHHSKLPEKRRKDAWHSPWDCPDCRGIGERIVKAET